MRQYTALLATEGVEISFTDDAIAQMAYVARFINEQDENIGARRLYTVIERVLEELSFCAPEISGQRITITGQYVTERLKDVLHDRDLSRHML